MSQTLLRNQILCREWQQQQLRVLKEAAHKLLRGSSLTQRQDTSAMRRLACIGIAAAAHSAMLGLESGIRWTQAVINMLNGSRLPVTNCVRDITKKTSCCCLRARGITSLSQWCCQHAGHTAMGEPGAQVTHICCRSRQSHTHNVGPEEDLFNVRCPYMYSQPATCRG